MRPGFVAPTRRREDVEHARPAHARPRADQRRHRRLPARSWPPTATSPSTTSATRARRSSCRSCARRGPSRSAGATRARYYRVENARRLPEALPEAVPAVLLRRRVGRGEEGRRRGGRRLPALGRDRPDGARAHRRHARARRGARAHAALRHAHPRRACARRTRRRAPPPRRWSPTSRRTSRSMMDRHMSGADSEGEKRQRELARTGRLARARTSGPASARRGSASARARRLRRERRGAAAGVRGRRHRHVHPLRLPAPRGGAALRPVRHAALRRRSAPCRRAPLARTGARLDAATRAVAISGSPRAPSKSKTLAELMLEALASAGCETRMIDVAELPAEALARPRAGARRSTTRSPRSARRSIVVAASPTYRALYTGVLKAFFDLMPPAHLARQDLRAGADRRVAGALPRDRVRHAAAVRQPRRRADRRRLRDRRPVRGRPAGRRSCARRIEHVARRRWRSAHRRPADAHRLRLRRRALPDAVRAPRGARAGARAGSAARTTSACTTRRTRRARCASWRRVPALRLAAACARSAATIAARAVARSTSCYIVTGRSVAGEPLLRRWLRRHGLADAFTGIRMAPRGPASGAAQARDGAKMLGSTRTSTTTRARRTTWRATVSRACPARPRRRPRRLAAIYDHAVRSLRSSPRHRAGCRTRPANESCKLVIDANSLCAPCDRSAGITAHRDSCVSRRSSLAGSWLAGCVGAASSSPGAGRPRVTSVPGRTVYGVARYALATCGVALDERRAGGPSPGRDAGPRRVRSSGTSPSAALVLGLRFCANASGPSRASSERSRGLLDLERRPSSIGRLSPCRPLP